MTVDQIRRLLAAFVFAVSFGVYLATISPTVSYWDCGEFIATSYILGVPHPPGSPLYLIIGRIFSMLPTSPDIGFRVNLISTVASSLAVMFLYLVIVQLITQWRGPVRTREDERVVFGAALIGSLAFAFTDSHWFNAVEAEVYAMSTLFTALVVWLILRWAEKSEQQGNERYILIISYVLGLASGVHLLNLLTLPFMGLIIYFKKRRFSWPSFFATGGIVAVSFLAIYLGIIKGFPKLANLVGVFGVVFLVAALFGFTIFAIVRRHWLWSTVLSCLVLVVVGYSTYAMLFIRSSQNPAIDENDPETVDRAVKYLEREQYGTVSFLPREYIKDRVGSLPHKVEVVGRPARGRDFTTSQNLEYMFHNFGRQLEFLWDYQIVRMYLRYFLWQFAGRGPVGEKSWISSFGALPHRDEDGVDWFQFFFPFPLILGLIGLVYHFRKDPARGFSVLTLFFMSGLAIILYLNQDKFQPRERDYSYVGSFLTFAIWIGIGTAAVAESILTKIKKTSLRTKLTSAALLGLFVLGPGVILTRNYHTHDRSGNYVAWDYSYNILQTCEPNAIIFTNGDNDTFPLWYLQEVEGVRKDVTVANLSLLNTEWYIRQLKESRPQGERFVNFSDEQIQGRELIGINPANGEDLFLQLSLWKETPVAIPVEDDPENEEGRITWNVKPTLGQGIRVQDLMIIHIINESKWQYPIYFAVTVSPNNRIGLDPFLKMDGLAFRLESHRVTDSGVPAIDYARLKENMATVVSDDGWSRQYQPGYRYRNLDNPGVYYDPNVTKLLQNYRSALLQLADNEFRSYRRQLRAASATGDQIESARLKALELLELGSTLMPIAVIPVGSEEMTFRMGQLYHDLNEVDKGKAILRDLHASRRPEIVGSLLKVYEDGEHWEEAIELLERWQDRFPDDTGLIRLLDEYRARKSNIAPLQ